MYSVRIVGKAMQPLESVLDCWCREFDGLYEDYMTEVEEKGDSDICFVLTCHPQIIGRPSRISVLTRLIEHDNETLLGWCKSHYKEEIDKILRQKNIVPENINYEASANLKYAASENEDCMTAEDKKYAAAYDTEARVLADRLLSRFYDTDAFIKIVPLQDILRLDNAARMNTPGTLGINWRWQAKEPDLYDADII